MPLASFDASVIHSRHKNNYNTFKWSIACEVAIKSFLSVFVTCLCLCTFRQYAVGDFHIVSVVCITINMVDVRVNNLEVNVLRR